MKFGQHPRSSVIMPFVFLFAACVSLVLCQGAYGDSKKGEVDPCGGMTEDLAGEMLGVSAAELKKSADFKAPVTCRIQSKSNFLIGMSYSIYIEESPEKAAKELNKIKEGLAFLSEIEAMEGLGDEAFWAGNKRARRLVARKGNVLIDVMRPDDLAVQKRIVRLVFENM